MKLCRLSLLVLLVSATTISTAQDRKVLIFGIDGCRSDALQVANTPNLDAAMDSGLYTLDSWHVGLTWSGPSWSTILTGVHWPKHGVTDNSFAGSNFNNYPPFPTLAKQVDPALKCVQVIEWGPLMDDINNAGWDKSIKVADGQTAATRDSVIIAVGDPDVDALFVYFDQVDLTGHTTTFSPQNTLYTDAITNVDGAIGDVLDALRNRPTYANEDWLVLFVTDHGGIGFSHGGNSLEERHIWWIAMGDAVEPRSISEADPGTYNCGNNEVFDTACVDLPLLKSSPTQADIAVTALHHLIYASGRNPETDTVWDLDGKSWLKTPVGIANTHNPIMDVYPNPTTGKVILEAGFDLTHATISVCDMLGRVVDVAQIRNGKRVQIDFGGHTKGVYLLRVQTQQGLTAHKVFVVE